jgi:immune inhibitor A
VSRTINPTPVSYQEGHRETFWVSELTEGTAYTIQATLKLVSEHAYWYVDDTLNLSLDDLKKAASVFESKIYPTMTSNFGDIWNPGVDNDPRLTVLHTPIKAADGYFGSQDEYPRQVHPHSNQREMIYMDGSRLRPGSEAYLGVLAHELQHAVHWNLDSGEDTWINEGMSEVAKGVAGYRASFISAFLQNPDTQLDYWPDNLTSSAPNYGAATLFITYLAQHYGGYERLKELVQHPADSINGVEAYLSAYGVTFLEVFKDWVVANYLDEDEGRYGYPGYAARVRDIDMMFAHGERQDTLPQLSARYIDLRFKDGDALVSFQGETTVPQVATSCHSGRYCWWSNRGDSIDSTLTREFDLSGLTGATLEFWTWYSVEENWDYAYVGASTDGGATWTLLQGQHTTSENPIGNSFGHGFTGRSGGWVQERIDLSPYVGKKVLVRFEYVTDDAVYLDGFVVDDIAVPELGFLDDAEQAGDWQAQGFVRTDNTLPQDYLVQIVEKGLDGKVSVRDVPLDEARKGQILVQGFGSRIENAVVIVSPVTLGTHQRASYTLTVGPAR